MTKNINNLLPLIKNHDFFKKNDCKLIGGTALSYHITHRLSEDLDFAFNGELPMKAIKEFIESLKKDNSNNITFIPQSIDSYLEFFEAGDDINKNQQDWSINKVKVTFVDISINVGNSEIFKQDKPTKIGDINIASLDTIFKLKSLMFYNRNKSRDYFDLLYLYKNSNYPYTIKDTIDIIQKYELLYKDNLEFLLKKIKRAKVIKEFDEPLFGLTKDKTNPSFNELKNQLLKELKNASN